MEVRKRIIFLIFSCCVLWPAFIFAAPPKKGPPVKRRFDCPYIIYDEEKKVLPNCGKTDGSITGLATHTDGTKINYTWHNAAGVVVGRNKDLVDVGEGAYRLEVSDNSGCANSVFSKYFLLESANVIKLFDGDIEIHPSTCNSDGFIKGLVVTGATLYTWKNVETGKEYVSTLTSDLFNIPTGSYILTASNDNGACVKTTQAYTVGTDFVVPDIIDFTMGTPNCANQIANISVKLHVTLGGPELTWYYALTDNPAAIVTEGRIFGNKNPITAELKSQPAGAYSFYVKKSDGGCAVKLASFPETVTELTIDVEKSNVFNDRCNQHRGSITPFLVGLPSAAPKGLTYTWKNLATGKVVSQIKSLFHAGEGQYELVVELQPTCFARQIFTITNTSPAIIPPKAAGTNLCLPGTVHIVVTNPDTAALFKLYTSEQDSVAIDSNTTGEFYRAITKTTDFFLTRKQGECESERTRVTETVVAAVNIPNTFTPNNDGVNDYWSITGLESFPGAEIKVYDRYGHPVYSSVNYANPFNGQSRGRPLPTGVYYYLIDVKERICFGQIAGSLTILH
jgi:gliding motility-associated-like protein